MSPVRVVTVTRLSQSLFWEASYLGRSLLRMPESLRPPVTAAFDNRDSSLIGLGELYNRVIDATEDDVSLVLVHDDVYLNDWFFPQRVVEALEHFDVIGVAGSANPDLTQPSWGLRFDPELRCLGWQPGLARSGVVNHFDHSHPNPSVYGPVPLACRLLDGLFLAIHTGRLKQAGVRFDPSFRFHCYDLDFCRSAAEKGLRIGTWPIAVTHNSAGAYDTEDFRLEARRYLAKWPAPVNETPEPLLALAGACVEPNWDNR